MPETAEDLLALLEAPHWKTPGSTSRRPEGPTARRTEGQAPVNVTVLDHIAAGRRTLAEANRLDATGADRDRRRADALRAAQAMKSQALLGEAGSARAYACPACGCYSLLMRQGRAVCANRHCAPAGTPLRRSWAPLDLVTARPGRVRGVRRSTGVPRDLVDRPTAVRFFAPTGHPVSASTITRLAKLYELPTWHRTGVRAVLYSLSDLMTAHAVTSLRKEPADCAAPRPHRRPACTGLADLFFNEHTGQNPRRLEQAKALCAACPLRAACLDQALTFPDRQLPGIYGGTTEAERRRLRKEAGAA